MKKILPSITLALASLAGFGGIANAGHTFGLFTGCHCCKACGGTITLRQYNAFSPVACGSMMFQGCVVAPPPAAPVSYGFDGFDGFSGGCVDGSCGTPVSRVPMQMTPGQIPAANYAYTYPTATYGVTMPQMPQVQMAPQVGQAIPAAARVP